MLSFTLKKQSYIKGEKLVVSENLIAKLIHYAHSSPNKIAVLSTDETWSYQKLYNEVLIWKNRLRALNITTPTLICLHRTPRTLAILLALQWLEIPYIPIELTTPLKRIRAIAEDSKASSLLHDTNQQEEYISLPCRALSLHELAKTGEANTLTLPEDTPPKKNKLAYIIYTSGSTGNPKGVSIPHKSLSNFLASMSKSFLNNQDEMLLATTTFAFDISYLEIYLPIWQGKSVFIANQNEHKDPAAIINIINNFPITICQGTPAFWNMLIYAGWQGKKELEVLCGGEPLKKSLAQNLLPIVKNIWNMYGPTEATIWCSLKQITKKNDISVGKPIHNMRAIVLDSNKNILPCGSKGELYFAGPGLAKGYINHQRLTEEKFTIYKSGLKTKRIYNTGDVAAINENGEIQIFGRVDNQIKLHGYRIELEDIEAHIQANHGVRECVVGVFNEQLVAYICINKSSEFSEDALTQQLERELPEYMIPRRFVYLESLPLNNSGKLDRKALSLPDNELQNTKSIHASPIEKKLQSIWQETLNISSISLNDSFFELGGHSLLATRIVTKIQKLFNKSIKIQDIYHAPTIAELSELINNAPSVDVKSKKSLKKLSSNWVPLTDFQFVLWMSNIFEPEVKKLNIVDRRRIKGKLNLEALNLALNHIINTHEVFSYAINPIFPLQKRKKKKPIKWQQQSLCKYSDKEIESILFKSLQKISSFRKWPKRKALIIANIFYLTKDRVEIQIAIPHLIADQQSIDIFFQQLSKYYLFFANKVAKIPKIEYKPFTSFAEQEYTHIQSSINSDEKFWLEYLKDSELFKFPKQDIIPCNHKSQQFSASIFHISEKQVSYWQEFCRKNAVTLNDLFCAAISLTLQKTYADSKIIPDELFINTVKSSREDPCFDEAIGCFLKAQPIKLKLTAQQNLVDLAKQAQQANAETANYQYASSLIKLSSIGRVHCTPNLIKSIFISMLAKLYGLLSIKAHNLNLPILKACKRLAKINSKRGFLININIWSNFFSAKPQNAVKLFGESCQQIPIEKKDTFTINGVLDISLMRDDLSNQAYLILSANLKPTTRDTIGKELLNTLSGG